MRSSRIALSLIVLFFLDAAVAARAGHHPRPRPRPAPRAGFFGFPSTRFMPKVSIVNVTPQRDGLDVQVKASVRGGGIGRVRLERDGETVATLEIKPAVQSVRPRFLVRVPPGEHTLRAIADQSQPGHQSKNGRSKPVVVGTAR